MKIFVFTDTYFGQDANYPAGGKNYINTFGSKFLDIFKKFKKIAKNYDLIVNLGDSFFNSNSKEDHERFKYFVKLFKGIKKPIYHLLGNHDTWNLSIKKLNNITKSKKYYSKNIKGIHNVFLTVDTNYFFSKKPYFKISKSQINWLRKDINKTKLPVIVYCHFLLSEQDQKKNYYFVDFKHNFSLIDNRKEVRKVLEKSNKVLLVLNGHMHIYAKEIINNIPYITVPSITENNGHNKPTEQYLEIEFKNNKLKTKIKKL